MRRIDDAPTRATHLSLNSAVLDMARELGMNVSATVDSVLAQEVQRRYWQRWYDENNDAIAHDNERIAREGLPMALPQLHEGRGPLMVRFDSGDQGQAQVLLDAHAAIVAGAAAALRDGRQSRAQAPADPPP